jgi:hypothetical protein
LNKEDAIKILETNINKKLLSEWRRNVILYSIIPTLIPVLALNVFFYLVPIQPLSLNLPTGLTPENVYPAIFTGTVTSISILAGFLSVSAYNFHQRYQLGIDESEETQGEVKESMRYSLEKKRTLEEEINKLPAGTEGLEELKNQIKTFDDSVSTLNENLELLSLNRDACAHSQEHMGHFLVYFLSTAVFLIVFLIFAFVLLETSSIIDIYYLVFDLECLITIFLGVITFMNQFMTITGHKDRY